MLRLYCYFNNQYGDLASVSLRCMRRPGICIRAGVFPHCRKCLLKVAGKMSRSTDRAGQETFAQGTPQCGEAFQVTRVIHSPCNIVIRTGCNPFRQSGIRQQTHALTGQEAIPRQCQHRYTHPQCLGAGGDALIREGIKRDIHALAGCEVFPATGHAADQFQPVAFDTMCGKASGDIQLNAVFNQRSCLQ